MTADYETIDRYVAPLAYALRRQYPSVDVDDIRQELVEWWLRNPGKAAEYLAHEDEKQGDRLIGSALMNRGRRYCLREQAAARGYAFRDLAFYSADQLDKELLPAMFDRDSWISPPQQERVETSTRQDPAHGNNWLASLADCADAYRRLSEKDRTLIRWRYDEDLPQRTIAGRLGISDQSASDALERARSRMIRFLGGDRPIYVEDEIPVGSRRSVSNAHAQATTGSEYDG